MSLPPIRRVAVIGAGISGVCSAAHLLQQGLQVTLFERSSISGGVWHFDEDTALEPNYPNETPSKGDYEKTDDRGLQSKTGYITPPRTPPNGSEAEKQSEKNEAESKSRSEEEIKRRVTHAPPGPCYAGLRNNVPLTLMKTSLADWPSGLEEYVSQNYLEEYVQLIAKTHGVNQIAAYDTRVEDVKKVGDTWKIRTITIRKDQAVQRIWDFDAVVVASGHYHMPRIPNIPGLKEWRRLYPARVGHSKGYRRSKGLEGENVLLLGAGTSSADIAKELASVANHIYQSSRGGQFDYPASSLPENGTRVGGIQSFDLPDAAKVDGEATLTTGEHIPGSVTLRSGQKLCNIDRVILCTGYVTSYPFLPQYHNDERSFTEAGDHVLVTKEGNMVHNLHKDIFHIEDPTLAFVGVPYHIATFSLFDFQGQAIARVFAGQTSFPSTTEMRQAYKERKEQKPLGRDFHSLRGSGAEAAYVADLISWVNRSTTSQADVKPLVGHTETWLTAYAAHRKLIEQRIGLRLADVVPSPNKFDSVVLSGPDVC